MEQTKFSINGVEYDVVKKGIAQASQVADLGRWLSIYGTPAIRSIQSDDEFDKMGGLELVSAVLGTLSGDALCDLFATVFGCGQAVAKEEFDIALLLDGIMALYNNAPSVKRLVGRFFSVTKQTSTTDVPSTPSE